MSDETFRWVVAGAVILAALCFVVQAGVMLALLKVAKATQKKVMPLAERAEPILESTRRILEENRPRIAEMSGEAVQIARSVREQVVHIGALVKETSNRAKSRVAQLDHTVDNTVEKMENVGTAMRSAVLRPMREVNGIVSGMRAAITILAQGGRRSSVDHATQDEEMFI